ncbi:MAG: 30S ribosomal protein S7 [Hadesarchaea archaeon YNP_N21]|nr:MAG: 30S ribosomal protein S7 [Hadesarchaea archaeon YNP_N21]
MGFNFKYFDKWDVENVVIKDQGLQRYIRLKPPFVLHSGGRQASKQFGKSEVTIVERLINKVMRSGPGAGKLGGKLIRDAGACGKKHKAYNIVKRAFGIIEERTKKNPVQVLVDAIQNAAPREETTRISYGGITYHVAVDSAPQRRLDIALKNLASGAFAASFSSKKSIEECLAEELIMAANYDMKSFAIARKEEMERIAKGAR